MFYITNMMKKRTLFLPPSYLRYKKGSDLDLAPSSPLFVSAPMLCLDMGSHGICLLLVAIVFSTQR